MAYYSKENYIQDRDVGACAVQPATALQERAQQLAKEFDHLELLMTTLTEKLQPFLLDDITAYKESAESPERENHSLVWEELNTAIRRVASNRIRLAQLIDRIET